MIKIILGTQKASGGIIKQSDLAIVTSPEKTEICESLIRLLSSNAAQLNDPNLPNIITVSDLETATDVQCLKENLRDSNLGLLVVDVIGEVGDEENSSLHVYVTNNNDSSFIKPAVVYHTNPLDLNEVKIISDIRERFRLFPDAVYKNSTFARTVESEVELQKVNAAHTEFNMVVLRNILTRIGFGYDIVTD